MTAAQENTFDIPVAVFMFLRPEKTVEVIKRISKVKPQKLYFIGDQGRTPEEQVTVQKCRRLAEEAVTWECELITNYAEENRGVYANIAGGAKWVFQREKEAIFLEDDNLPEVSFFYFCKEMLMRYREAQRVLWICGTNYLEEFASPYDYLFTQHMLPCGWASWADKFNRYYDGELQQYTAETAAALRGRYPSDALYRYDLKRFNQENDRKLQHQKFLSWDYQMAFSLRFYDLLGVIPVKNQIVNIGVDAQSIHGGSSFDNIMTKRFCGMDSIPLEFPLKHPPRIEINDTLERKLTKIIIPPKPPFKKRAIAKFRNVCHIPDGEHTWEYLARKLGRKP